jgi:hypothetical protein
MKTVCCCLLALVCTMLVASASHANPATEMKSSPLFASALELSVARLEGRTLEKEELLVTTTPGCEATPDAPYTQQPVYTCGWQCDTQWETCNYTCQGATCYNTCQYTCGQSTCASTCANTCVPGACANYNFNGVVYWWDNYYGGYGSNWQTGIPYGYFDAWWYCGTSGDGGRVSVQLNGSGDFVDIGPFSVSNGAYSHTKAMPVGASRFTVQGFTTVGYSCSGGYWPTWGRTSVNQPPQGSNTVYVFVPLFPF